VHPYPRILTILAAVDHLRLREATSRRMAHH
jgi:hypothetical protein